MTPHQTAILLVPLLQIVDRWLTFRTVAAARRFGHSQIATEALEANPLWRASVAQGRRYDPRFVTTVAVTTIILVVVARWFGERQIEFLLGAAFVLLGMAIGQSLSHLLLLHALARHPDEIARLPAHSPAFALHASSIKAITWLPPALLLLLAQPGFLMAGAVFGVFAFVAMYLAWARMAAGTAP